MRKDGGKMILLRKYFVPLFGTILSYTLIFLMAAFFNKSIWIDYFSYLPFTIGSVILIRLTDDYTDYKKDYALGKVVFSRMMLMVLIWYVFLLLTIGLFKEAFPLTIIIMQIISNLFIIFSQFNFFLSKVSLAFLKTLFIPLVITNLYICLNFNTIVLIMVIVSFILSIIFYIIKIKKGEKNAHILS